MSGGTGKKYGFDAGVEAHPPAGWRLLPECAAETNRQASCLAFLDESRNAQCLYRAGQLRKKTMVKHGIAPFLECSSRGDSRLSAFCAKIKSRNNQTIEAIYQAAKVFPDGSTGLHWRNAKGKKPVNIEYVRKLYAELWDDYIYEHPELLDVITAASGLSDMFGKTGNACQATELWRIRCQALGVNPEIESNEPQLGFGF